MSLERELQNLLRVAQDRLAQRGIAVESLHYAVYPDQKSANDVVGIAFNISTDNQGFFGAQYTNTLRIAGMSLLYDTLGDVAFSLPLEPWLDYTVTLRTPVKPAVHSPLQGLPISAGNVDVNTDFGLHIVKVDDELQKGTLKPGGLMERYCREYGVDVLKHGRHHISPDPITMDAFRAVRLARNVRSALELGAGTGICGAQAQLSGIRDFTFVDNNETVCKYLKRQPYPVHHESAFNYNLNRSWDVILLGLQYEQLPWFLEQRGADLAEACDTIVIQSGSPAFFQHEHDWIAGKSSYKSWGWWKHTQTVLNHFPFMFETQFGYQTAIIASHQPLGDIEDELWKHGGFKEPSYTTITA